MIKFFRSIPNHVKTAFQSLTRHGAMTFSSVSAVMITLTLLMVFILIAGNISNFTVSIEKSLMIHSTIDGSLNEEGIEELQRRVENLDHVVKVTFSSKDEELENYMSSMDEASKKLYETYEGDGNPLLNAFQIEVDAGENMEVVYQKLQNIEGIQDSDYGGDTANLIVKTMDGLRIGGGIFVAALGVLAVFLISNTIKSAIYSRKSEISIMRNVGATNGYIKFPFMIEGMFIGILGAILPILITCFGYRYLYETMNGIFLIPMFQLQTVEPFIWYVSLILLGTGMIVGVMGSFFAVNKYLKWKR